MNKRELKKEVAKWLTRTYGKRVCDEYDEDCIICKKWHLYDELFKEY